jgi:hypothetical protein
MRDWRRTTQTRTFRPHIRNCWKITQLCKMLTLRWSQSSMSKGESSVREEHKGHSSVTRKWLPHSNNKRIITINSLGNKAPKNRNSLMGTKTWVRKITATWSNTLQIDNQIPSET